MRVLANIVLGSFVPWSRNCNPVNFAASFHRQPRLEHLVLDCARLTNPLRVANYQEEDLVGRIKRTLGVYDLFGCANPKALNLPNAQFPSLPPRLAVSEILEFWDVRCWSVGHGRPVFAGTTSWWQLARTPTIECCRENEWSPLGPKPPNPEAS